MKNESQKVAPNLSGTSKILWFLYISPFPLGFYPPFPRLPSLMPDPTEPSLSNPHGPWELREIGVLRTCYAEKFGVPRQSGLVPSAWGEILLHPEFAREEAFRGIESPLADHPFP